jgi:hypothetical protein
MNPKYLWLTEGTEFLAIFVVGPAIAIATAYGAWRGKPGSVAPARYRLFCATSGAAALLLFRLAKWINADVRTPEYFLQLACVLLFGLSFGVFMGCGFAIMLHIWHWHKTTRLTQSPVSDEPETHDN